MVNTKDDGSSNELLSKRMSELSDQMLAGFNRNSEDIADLKKEFTSEYTGYVITKISEARTDMEHTIGIYHGELKRERTRVNLKFEELERRNNNEDDEKAHRTLIIKNVEILAGADANKKQLIQILITEKVKVDHLSEVQIVRKADKQSGLTTCTAYLVVTSPLKVDKIRGELIELCKRRITSGHANHRVVNGKKIFLLVEGYIPLHRREEKEALEKKGRQLKGDRRIFAWRVILVKVGPPLNAHFFLSLVTKQSKSEKFKPCDLKAGERQGQGQGRIQAQYAGGNRGSGPAARLRNDYVNNPNKRQSGPKPFNPARKTNFAHSNRFEAFNNEEYHEERDFDRDSNEDVELEKQMYQEVLLQEQQIREEHAEKHTKNAAISLARPFPQQAESAPVKTAKPASHGCAPHPLPPPVTNTSVNASPTTHQTPSLSTSPSHGMDPCLSPGADSILLQTPFPILHLIPTPSCPPLPSSPTTAVLGEGDNAGPSGCGNRRKMEDRSPNQIENLFAAKEKRKNARDDQILFI